jgi:group I intron endonuclease
MISGIYLLRFKDGSVYVGQSRDIYRRYTTHCNKLEKGTHSNSKVSSAYSKYGKPVLEVLLECATSTLDINEKEAIQIYDSINNGLNIAPAGGEFPILNGESNGFSRYSDSEIISAMEYLANNLNQPLKVSADILGINYSTIKNISNGTSHRWLSQKIPDTYNKVLSHKGKRIINTSGSKGRSYTAISPTGIIYTNITNITTFAKEHGLNRGALGEVVRGNAHQHKGWTSIPNPLI